MVTLSSSSEIARAYLALTRHDVKAALAALRHDESVPPAVVTVAPLARQHLRKLHETIVSAFEVVAGDDEGEPTDEDFASILAFSVRVHASWPVTCELVELALWDVGEDTGRAARIERLAREMWIEGAQ